MSAPPAAAIVDAVTVKELGPRLILTTFVGRSTRVLSEAARLDFEKLIMGMDRPVWISDARRLTGFEPSSLAYGARWFSLFRERGGQHCLVISHWDMAMLAASTMALGLGVRIQNFARLDAAVDVAKQLLQET